MAAGRSRSDFTEVCRLRNAFLPRFTNAGWSGSSPRVARVTADIGHAGLRLVQASRDCPTTTPWMSFAALEHGGLAVGADRYS